MKRRDFLKLIGIAPLGLRRPHKPSEVGSAPALAIGHTIELGYIEDWQNYDFDGEILRRIKEMDDKAQV